MKILIIDDEFSAREAIKMMVSFKDYGFDTVLEADNGVTGLELIKNEMPDLILTDMKMPEMDGACLLQVLEKLNQSFKIIVISGFSDFEYTRSAIHSKVIDYILKPISKDSLVAAITKAIKEINYMQPGSGTESSGTDELLAALRKKGPVNDIRELLGQIDTARYKPDCKGTALAFIKLLNIDELTGSSFKSYVVILFHQLNELISEFFEDRGYNAFIRLFQEEHEAAVLIQPEDCGMSSEDTELKACFEALADFLKQKLGVECILAFNNGPLSSGSSIKKTRRALMNANLLGKSRAVSFAVEAAFTDSHVSTSIVLEEEKLANAILNGDMEQVDGYIDGIALQLGSRGRISIGELEYLCLEMLVMVSNLMKSLGIDAAKELIENEGRTDFGRYACSCSGTRNWMLELCRWATDCIIRENKDASGVIAKDIIRYINTYYYENIDLEMLSHKFFISREHISRILKKELGENFVTYITRIRLNKALEMLKDPENKLQCISDMTGFSDVSYFSKVFKKYFGVSPNEYRSHNA